VSSTSVQLKLPVPLRCLTSGDEMVDATNTPGSGLLRPSLLQSIAAGELAPSLVIV